MLLFGCQNKEKVISDNVIDDTSTHKVTEKENIINEAKVQQECAMVNDLVELNTVDDLLSNHYVIDSEQSFLVELNNLGKIRFISTSIKTGDRVKVNFFLMNNEEVVMKLLESNIDMSQWNFDKVLAVSFKDVNKDGETDIIAILEYASKDGKEVTNKIVADIFLYEGGEFISPKELVNSINENYKIINVSQVSSLLNEYFAHEEDIDKQAYKEWGGLWISGENNDKGRYSELIIDEVTPESFQYAFDAVYVANSINQQGENIVNPHLGGWTGNAKITLKKNEATYEYRLDEKLEYYLESMSEYKIVFKRLDENTIEVEEIDGYWASSPGAGLNVRYFGIYTKSKK